MGKGSGRRPEDNQAFLSNYDKAFGSKEVDDDSNRQDVESGQRQHAVDSPPESGRGESEDEGAYADD